MNYEAKVLGIHYLDFKNDSGEVIKGYQIFVAAKTDQQSWTQGMEILKCWIGAGTESESVAQALIPGDLVQIAFNRRGKPVIMEVL